MDRTDSAPESSARPTVARWLRATRLGLICLAVLLISAALYGHVQWRQERAALLRLLIASDLENQDVVAKRVAHELTAHHARLIVARALVYAVLDNAAAKPGEARPLEPRRAQEQLVAARELAATTLETQPNSWQATMLLGATLYLERALLQDRRLYTAAADWELPLHQAMDDASGKAEPRRFLLAAYLEVWPNLSAEKKALTRQLLAQAFAEDPEAIDRLLPTWLAVARRTEEAFQPIPERPDAWRRIVRAYELQLAWPRFCAAYERYLDALEHDLQARLAEAEERLALGDYYNGRSMLLRVILEAPIDRRFAPIVTRALGRYPPGLHALSSTQALEQWLDWALELHSISGSSLPPLIVSRLAGAAGQLAPPKAALAALVGGEQTYADQLERLADSLSQSAWAPYLIAKANRWLAANQPVKAMAVLDQVDSLSRRDLVLYALARQRAAQANGDLAALAEAEKQLVRFRARAWQAQDWRWQGREASLLMLPEAPAKRLTFDLNQVPQAGAVVVVGWDGAVVARRSVMPGERITLDLMIDTSLHRLELKALAGGGKLFPGKVLVE